MRFSRKPTHKMRRIAGFSLAEVLVALVILTTLSLLIVPRLVGKTEKARRAAAVMDIEHGLPAALDDYEADCGKFPTTEQGLDALKKKPTTAPIPDNWQGPYLKKANTTDPWGKKYQYRFPGVKNATTYDLFSYGADGKEGGEGNDKDIGNWE